MAIPAAIPTALGAFVVAVKAAAPLARATRITIAALETQGSALLAQIDAALAAAGAPLDADDPTGYPGAFAGALLQLAAASEDQARLSDMRGLVGRAMFNLSQAQPG